MLIQIIFSLGLAHANPVPFFSLGLAHANPDPFFHWAWHMLIQIHFSLGLAHANPDPFFTGLVSRPKQSPCLWCLQSHRPCDSSGGSYPQDLSSMHGVDASPCHLHCLDTIIQYIVVRLILREWHSPSAR